MTRPVTVDAWLAYLETLHPRAIALGLDRVRAVAAQLGASITCPVITVTGTNGKGSTCAMLESILRAAGYRVGLYTSPHLMRYHERVRIVGTDATDAELLAAFAAVEDARLASFDVHGAPILLTYFEFGTLAALWLFARANLEVLVLEVGLGGRLDAVNIIDADVAVVTSVDIDHVDFLGAERESIGREKAGIFRHGRPAVCGDTNPPASLVAAAAAVGAILHLAGRDFGYVAEGRQWRYSGQRERYGLPFPALRGQYQLGNAAVVLAVLDLLHDRLPVSAGALRDGLLTVSLSGRFEVLPGRPTIVLDVAHNPHAARALAGALGDMGYHPATVAVCGMLADKDIAGVVAVMRPRVDRWYVASLPSARGASADKIRSALLWAGVDPAAVRAFDSVGAAVAAARDVAGEADRIVVFGSFLTVAAAKTALSRA
ncbi:MAG: bifunctional tetrahydrofolate synthase/dihydrofolate synthase [Betaproteobacteria bacterium]